MSRAHRARPFSVLEFILNYLARAALPDILVSNYRRVYLPGGMNFACSPMLLLRNAAHDSPWHKGQCKSVNREPQVKCNF